MPPMAAAVGSDAAVHDVANYVLSLSDSPHDAISAQRGRAKFAVCAACHGHDGKGNRVSAETQAKAVAALIVCSNSRTLPGQG